MRLALYRTLLEPRSKNEDDKRRERILTILLLGSVVLAFVALLKTITQIISEGSRYNGTGHYAVLLAFLVFLGLYILSRVRFYHLAAYLLIALYFLLGVYSIQTWGTALPTAILVFVFVIVMSGVVVSTRFAALTTALSSAVFLIFAYLESTQRARPDTSWISEQGMGEAITFAVMLGIIALVSGLSNREIERSLRRARKSEAALKKERDVLEQRVAERTEELKRAQLEKMLQLYRFAEFGRVSAGLLHDLANPLTAVSLNLEQLGTKKRSELLERAIRGLKHIEQFVQAARKQIQNQSELSVFIVRDELKQALRLLDYRARSAAVKLKLKNRAGGVTLYGNHLKFHQLVSNLVSNAIDAYEGVRRPAPHEVSVTLEKKEHALVLSVHDAGKGIPRAQREQIFDPFFTTKKPGRGTGIGLSIVKNIVEGEFFGTISVTSSRANGTIFTVTIPLVDHASKRP